MTSSLVALHFDANDPHLLAGFWAGLLKRRIADDGVTLAPDDANGFGIQFQQTLAPRSGPNWMHPHLTSSSLEDQQSTVARALELGGRHLDVGQAPEDEHVVLADPEGNEFCVIEPGNRFLAGCGFLAELTCDGSQEVGYFWSQALGWPLVWDQDGETSIQSPSGGTKISWGGPPEAPKTVRNRLRFDLAPADGDLQDEVDRLLGLGASLALDAGVEGAGVEVDAVAMADPGGNEFTVSVPR